MKKSNKKNFSMFLISIILLSMLGFSGLSLIFQKSTIHKNENIIPLKSAQIDTKNLNVAIYNEPNITEPGYSSYSTLTNNYTGLKELLIEQGFGVTELTTQNILDHELKTSEYDVFILVDNLPKVNIVDFVKEFWLGGGSILSFDSALSYLIYSGILIPELEGDESYSSHWAYANSDTHNISSRHPCTKEYQIDDSYDLTKTSNAYLQWNVLLSTSVGDQVTKLSNVEGVNSQASGVALDPINKGGKVVQLPGTVEEIDSSFEDLLLDSLQWLIPKPKARILFDLSHVPWYGIDSWDNASYPERLHLFRNSLVNRSYLFDKQWNGPITNTILEKYDILIIAAPGLNLTTSEISSIQNWIDNGGNFLGMGLRNVGGLSSTAERINDILEPYDLKIAPNVEGDGLTDFLFKHPIMENVYQIDTSYSNPGFVNYSGAAKPLIGNSEINVMAAAQESGEGRIVLLGDLFFLRYTHIILEENMQFGINILNWLSANKAKVLLNVDEPDSPNYYQTPVVKALNTLQIPFYLTFSDSYFNLSLSTSQWNLVIFDNPWLASPEDTFDSMLTYMKGGGKLLISTHTIDNYMNHPLWAELGFEYSGSWLETNPSISIWNSGHRIFNNPINYGGTSLDTTRDYGDDGDLLEVYSNATALAGFTSTLQKGNATIVLRNDGKSLCNAYLIDGMQGDIDDSTYTDNYEIWINQISYMMRKPASGFAIPGYNTFIIFLSLISFVGIISYYRLKKR